MTIEWLAGNRLKGTTAERPSASLQSPSVGGWVEVGRTTLSSASDKIDVESLPNKRYYMVLFDHKGQANTNATIRVRYNNTTNSDFEYAGRYAVNGASDSTYINELSNFIGQHSEDTSPKFRVSYISNFLNKEKLIYGHMVEQSTAGSGTSPNRAEDAEKWIDNAVISSIEYDVGASSNSFNAGSEVVVLGWDPADSHTTNFWEELASVTTSSASDTVDTGSFSQKKYLWIQIYNPAKPTGSNTYAYFNNVTTGTTHSGRSNTNGVNPSTGSAGSDYQLTGSNGSILNHDPSDPDSGTTPMFTNMFVINNADKEKLSIVHSVSGWSSTTGAGQIPARYECVGKWSKTDQAITSVQCGGMGTNGMGSGSIIKVWGAN